MKQPWCLATSLADQPARALINLYAKRWQIEGGFRDSKDLRFGMGMGSIHVSTPERRDRLWLVSAFAVVLLTLYQPPYEMTALAHSREAMDRMVSGAATRAFQASQQASTMAV